jgi:tryptophanyl-tRNA synthetase
VRKRPGGPGALYAGEEHPRHPGLIRGYVSRWEGGEPQMGQSQNQHMAKRILTGDRPTGPLHLGHYVGSLATRLQLQHDYETFVEIADVQALTDHCREPEVVRDGVRQVAMDYLAVGIDPEVTTIFVQSLVSKIAELTIYYLNLVTLSRLQRNPTVKDEMRQKGYGNDVPVGFLAYPIGQAADITIMKAHLVPAGEDQAPMIEQTREIVRGFNMLYQPLLVEPERLVSNFPSLPGIDGKAKMSKTAGNASYLADDPETVTRKGMRMYTDPTRLHPTDPGHVEGHPLFIYHDACNPNREEVEELRHRYARGRVGDVEVKQKLASALNTFLDPIRERRRIYERDAKLLDGIVYEGSRKARGEAQKTMEAVREALKLYRSTIRDSAAA